MTWLLALLSLLMPSLGTMQIVMGAAPIGDTIAFDGAAALSMTTSGNTAPSFSGTVTSNAAGIICGGSTAVDTAGTALVSGMTWNSAALSNVLTEPATMFSANSNQAALWCKLAPATGTHTFAASYATGPNIGQMLGEVSLTGVHQSLTPEATAVNTSGSAINTISITTIAANAWVIAVQVDNNNDTITAASGCTLRWTATDSSNRTGAGVTCGPFVSPGAYTVGFVGATGAVSILAASFAPGP